MAVQNIPPRKLHTYTGAGDYEASFKVYDPTTIQVIVTYADGSQDTLAYLTDYTVDIPDDDPGVTVTVISEDYDEATSLEIERVLPYTQTTDWANGSSLDMPLLTRSFDQAVMLLQQMNQTVLAGTSAFSWEGTWTTGTSYLVRAMVEGPDGNWYYCTESHTAGTFSLDLAAGIWILLINRASLLAAVAAAEDAEQGALTAQVAAEYAQQVAQDASLNIVDAWLVGTTYNFPTLVAGTDGHTYRCLGTAVVGVDPTTDDGTTWFRLTGMGGVPVGSIVPFIGGYFTDGSNGGFTSVLGNTVAAVNLLLNDTGFYVCDGAALNNANSSIFDGAGRYLPNLTDDRFIMGDDTAGAIGGNSAMAHTHDVDIASFTSGATTLTTTQIPSHSHSVSVGNGGGHTHTTDAWRMIPGGTGCASGSGGYGGTAAVIGSVGDHGHSGSGGSTGGGGSHTHAVDPANTTSSSASVTENRPKFLSCFYIMKVA